MMGVTLFTVFTAMEMGLALLNCKKHSKTVENRRNKLICFGLEFAVMLLVILLPATEHKVRFIGCLAVFAVRLFFAAAGYIWRMIKHYIIGAEETETSELGSVIALMANVALIFCFVFPTVVFPEYKEFESSENSTAVMHQLLDNSNENADSTAARINTAIFEYVVSE